MPQSLFTGKPGTTHFQTQDTTVVEAAGTIEAMHCHIVYKIQQLRKIANDLESKVAEQEGQTSEGQGPDGLAKLANIDSSV